MRIWDAETFEPVARLAGHEDFIYSVAWRADSQQLISGSGDNTVRIWDTVPMKDRMQARRERQALLAQVEPGVQRLFVELGDAGKVVEKVKSDQSLSPRARQVARQMFILFVGCEGLKQRIAQLQSSRFAGSRTGQLRCCYGRGRSRAAKGLFSLSAEPRQGPSSRSAR